MRENNKIYNVIIIISALIIILISTSTYFTTPESFSNYDVFMLFVSFYLLASVLIRNSHEKSFEKASDDTTSAYKYPLKTRKKWSVLYILFSFVTIPIIASFIYMRKEDTIYIPLMIFIGILGILIILEIVKNILVYKNYGEIDPNYKYTILGLRKIENEE